MRFQYKNYYYSGTIVDMCIQAGLGMSVCLIYVVCVRVDGDAGQCIV